MSERLRIHGARILDPSQGWEFTGDLFLSGGVLMAAVPEGALTPEGFADAETLDARGLVAAPGLVDLHVHLRDPGQTQKEDILSGCAAALAGGVTTRCCMPNTIPVADAPEVIRYIVEKAAQTPVRVLPAAAISKGLSSETLTDFEALTSAGAAAFTDDGRPAASAAVLRAALRAAAKVGRPVLCHCEDMSLAAGGLVNEGEASRALGVPGLPASAATVHAAREMLIAMEESLPVHLMHMSAKGSVELIRDLKRRGARVTAETCPHYFALDELRTLTRDADYRMNPPLRAKADIAAVIEALRDGTLDCISTDHAPHTAADKADFEKAPNGIVGLETLLAAGITYLVKPGHLTLSGLLAKMTVNPARVLGVNAGTLRPGARADVVLFDPEESWTVDPAKLHSRAHNTAFKGITLSGRVRRTIAGGQIVYTAEPNAQR